MLFGCSCVAPFTKPKVTSLRTLSVYRSLLRSRYGSGGQGSTRGQVRLEVSDSAKVVVSEVRTWLVETVDRRTRRSSVGSDHVGGADERAGAAPTVDLDEVAHRLVQRFVEADRSWGLLLVPVTVCVALMVYAMFLG